MVMTGTFCRQSGHSNIPQRCNPYNMDQQQGNSSAERPYWANLLRVFPLNIGGPTGNLLRRDSPTKKGRDPPPPRHTVYSPNK